VVTLLGTATRVRAAVDGRLTAECRLCRVHLEQLAGTDVQRALSAFDDSHPPGDVAHRRTLPWGWRTAPPARSTT
jgi:hypothetical protein